MFSRGGIIKGQPRWYKAAKDAVVTIDPIGTPRFRGGAPATAAAVTKRGDDVTLRPALYTGDGLLIVIAYRGNPVSPAMQEILSAVVKLCEPIGTSTGDGRTRAFREAPSARPRSECPSRIRVIMSKSPPISTAARWQGLYTRPRLLR